MHGVVLWMPSVGETAFARSGQLVSGAAGQNQLVLEDGSLILGTRKTVRELRFDRMTADLPSRRESLSRGSTDQREGATVRELIELQPAASATKRPKADSGLQLHRRMSLPATTLGFGLLIVPLFLALATIHI